jgi:hypothetical protein
MCLDIEYLGKQCYAQQNSNKNMRSWTVELTEKLYGMELSFVCVCGESNKSAS